MGIAGGDGLPDALGGRILARVGLGIAVSRDGKLVYCNGAFESITGLDRAAIEGRPHPFLREGRAAGGAELRERLEGRGEATPVRVRYDREDGFPTWNEVQIYHDGEYVVWIHRDITQQIATHELWNRYAFLVDASRQFMALVDRDYHYELVNPAFAALFGAVPNTINGSSGASLWGETLFNTMVAPCLDRCFAGAEVHDQRWVTLPRGGRRYLHMVYTPYRGKEGPVRHAIFVAWDNTEEKIATDTASDLNRVLEHRVEERTAELQDTMQELEAFNYTIAHDLRSPLRFLKSFALMLEEEAEGCLGDTGLYYCDMISRGVAEMQHLIDRLLDFARLSRKPITLDHCDLNAIATSARETVLLDQDANVSIAPLPPCRGDAPLLKQVFVNLLGNAVKFAGDAKEPRVEVYSAPPAPGMVHLCVRDNGIGFHMSQAEAMFAPFKQVHEGDRLPGSGLGLAIVRRIVERHGGAVWAEGRPGAGATFHIQLQEDTSGTPAAAAPAKSR